MIEARDDGPAHKLLICLCERNLLQRVGELLQSGVQVIALLALSDEGAPSYDRQLAAKLAALGAPAFACTPDRFPDLMAAAIRREDLGLWAARQGIVAARAETYSPAHIAL
jgi:hypothetical protein